MMMSQKPNKATDNFFYLTGKHRDGDFHNNNNNNKTFGFSSNMFEALDKQAPLLPPSFLNLEPVPEVKVAEQKRDPVARTQISLAKPRPNPPSLVGRIGPKAAVPQNTENSSARFFSNCDSNGSSPRSPANDGLMPPPPISAKMSESLKSKVVKKKPLVSHKSRRFCCRECDLGVTFKSKLELQHHLSGMSCPLLIVVRE